MKKITAILEFSPETNQYFAYVPGVDGLHSVGDTEEESLQNLREVYELLSVDSNFKIESSFHSVKELEMS